MPPIYKKWLSILVILSTVMTIGVLSIGVWLNQQYPLLPELDPPLLWFSVSFIIGQNLLVIPWFYWLDKRRAMQGNKERIPELILHLGALLGGGFGALYGQQRYRHKTNKTRFQLTAWLGIVLVFGLFYHCWIADSKLLATLLK